MYVDAFLDRKTDTIHIAERIDTQRVFRDLPASYVFFYEDNSGSYRSIFGHRCKRYASPTSQKFYSTLREKREAGRRIFESDINPVFRALADNYMGADAPALHIGLFDIEAAFDPERSFAPPDDPFSPITAISLFRSADNKLLSFLLKPPTLSWDEAQRMVERFEDSVLFDDERCLLLAFLDAIDDVDLLSGWNSSSYDIPYLVNRIRRILSIDTTRYLCLWGQLPSKREYKNKFQRMVNTYDLVGRVHLDYLDLYAKHNQQQRQSYRLDYIGEMEVGEKKIPYEGTLDTLYKQDFDRFIQYNRQDVMIMVKLDRKLRYIELANQIAHANCVLFKTTMGSVALVEQAIINEMHAMNCVVPERPRDIVEDDDVMEDDDDDDAAPVEDGRSPVVGAYVAQPKTGLHEHIACVDINSLYPSAIRALNMSPETLVGQVRSIETMALVHERASKLPDTKRAEAWDGLFSTLEVQHMHAKDDTELTVDFYDHLKGTTRTETMTGKELYDYIFNPKNHVCISANGTIFDTSRDGMIPALLTTWYAERKEMQAKQHEWEKKRDAANSDEAKGEAAEWASFWDRRQLARKILLNSLYGALLNEGLRFYDEQLGQSVTLCGRSIDQHMDAAINQIITGVYDYRGEAIVYADTDSCYFSAYTILKDKPEFSEIEWTRENIIALYDGIAEQANRTFPAFMQRTFNTSIERGRIIRAGRELVASKGLFIKKKKYAVLMYDREGTRLDVDRPGKLKPMGLDLKRSDTPKVMQQFLEKMLMDLLVGEPREAIFADIMAFRQEFKQRPGWEKGAPKKVADVLKYGGKLRAASDRAMQIGAVRRHESLKVQVPYHVTAAMNWNKLCEMNNDNYSARITDGARVVVCRLRSNTMGMSWIAYPVDEPHLPAWFRELPFDDQAMEETIIDSKIKNLVGVLNWDLTDTKIKAGDSLFSWS